jgi:hypothetical protein
MKMQRKSFRIWLRIISITSAFRFIFFNIALLWYLSEALRGVSQLSFSLFAVTEDYRDFF